MAVTLLIIGVCLGLFVYWFRYTVVLILRTPAGPEYAKRVAAANQLNFVQVRQKLHSPVDAVQLGLLCDALHRDYASLKYLLRHAATLQANGYTAEQRLLMVNFRCMALWCKAILRFRPAAAKMALLEMSGTLEYFANAMGRRFATLAGETSQA